MKELRLILTIAVAMCLKKAGCFCFVIESTEWTTWKGGTVFGTSVAPRAPLNPKNNNIFYNRMLVLGPAVRFFATRLLWVRLETSKETVPRSSGVLERSASHPQHQTTVRMFAWCGRFERREPVRLESSKEIVPRNFGVAEALSDCLNVAKRKRRVTHAHLKGDTEFINSIRRKRERG